MKAKILFIIALLLTLVQGVWADDKDDYGVLNGEFSIAAGTKVHFSKGNLRAYYYLSKTWYWSFAMNQYDYVGNAVGNTIINGKGSLSSTNQFVDLFGWSTSSTSYGIYNSTNNSDYSGSLLDWGSIAIGDKTANCWFTMSYAQWSYLLNSRTTTTTNMPTGTNSDHARYIKAQVASKNGLILFPDNYAHPAGASVSVSSAAYNTANKGYGSFTVNAENWTKMEEAGAVFLPAGGYRHGTEIIDAGSYGAYWTSGGTSLDYSGSILQEYSTLHSTGCSVRLVINFTTITYNANGGEGTVESQPKYTGLDRTLSDGTGLSRSGYILDGWATATDGAKVYNLGATYTEDADVTLYAHWTPVNDVTWDATDEEKNNWTIDPVNPVAAGAAVTATYGGTRHVKSVTYRPAGTIGGKFTINGSGDKVYFSKGNLQLVGENIWKFADNQWDYFGDSQSDNHRDLFGWGTANNPNLTTENPYDYASFTDWGENTYLQATLGAGWYTLTQPEWEYLFVTRSASTVAGVENARYAKGKVNALGGVILFPDSYTHPAGVAAPVDINTVVGHTDHNIYSAADWAKMEAAGCVFLPFSGFRIGKTVDLVNTRGSYWTSSEVGGTLTDQAYGIYFYLYSQNLNNNPNRYQGYSVRLVRDVAE